MTSRNSIAIDGLEVAAMRKKMGMSRGGFGVYLGLSTGIILKWETTDPCFCYPTTLAKVEKKLGLEAVERLVIYKDDWEWYLKHSVRNRILNPRQPRETKKPKDRDMFYG